MEIIPVIDLKGGQAVHAKLGLRDQYRPLQTPLCPDGDPFTYVTALLSLFPFRTIYVADLDALMEKGSNLDLIQQMIMTFDQTEFWVDQGLDILTHQDTGQQAWTAVLGSESLPESGLKTLLLGKESTVLSLDFSEHGILGPEQIIENEYLWPERTIIMSLASVGGPSGPNWNRLDSFRRNWPQRDFFAAGGVRNAKDLGRLSSSGFAGVLVATALHRGDITAPLIARFMTD